MGENWSVGGYVYLNYNSDIMASRNKQASLLQASTTQTHLTGVSPLHPLWNLASYLGGCNRRTLARWTLFEWDWWARSQEGQSSRLLHWIQRVPSPCEHLQAGRLWDLRTNRLGLWVNYFLNRNLDKQKDSKYASGWERARARILFNSQGSGIKMPQRL